MSQKATAFLRTCAALFSFTFLLIAMCSESPTGPKAKPPVALHGGLLIEYPNSGEAFKIGDTVLIKLGYVQSKASPFAGRNGVLTLLDERGRKMVTITSGGTFDVISTTSYKWAIPDSLYMQVADPIGGFKDSLLPLPTNKRYWIIYEDYDEDPSEPTSDLTDTSFVILPKN